MTLLTDALALTKSKTDPTPASPADSECTRFRGDADRCLSCGGDWPSHVRGFGSKQQPLAPGMKRVPRA